MQFLRTFHGHAGRSCSYARFPYEQLDTVLNVIKDSNTYTKTDNIGIHELDGKICVFAKNALKTEVCCIRRKNGEDCWNVCLLRSPSWNDFSDNTMLEFLSFLKGIVDLQLPKEEWEYLQPLSEETVQKYTVEEKMWGRTDNFTIRQAEELEKGWNEDRNA